MNNYCCNRENLMNFALTFVIVLNIVLLTTDSYFSLAPLDLVEFGIYGAVIDNKHVSYTEILNNCTLEKYCEKVPDFKKSGTIMQALIILDIFTVSAVIIQNIFLEFLMKRLLKDKGFLTKCTKCAVQGLVCGKNLLFVHPVLMNLGIILWASYSKLSDISNKLVLHEGMIILIVQCFLSLLSMAYNIWVIGSIKRRNLRLLRSNSYKKEDLSISI